jgi:hypothetical protein
MAPLPPQTASASLATYHSAYNGYVLDRNGRFTYFIQQPDGSHLQNGYWRFTSSQHERLAYERGYHNPEDIMVAADSGEHHDVISLLWVPGTVDPNLKSQISGNARAHLRNIYDMRSILQKALSFRGRVPTYPVSHLLREYWEARRTAWSLPVEQYAAQASMEPTSMLPQSEGVSSPIVVTGHQETLPHGQRTHTSQRLYSSDLVMNTAASSVVRSPAQSPGMTGTPLAPRHSTSPKSFPKHARASQHAENTTAPSQPAVHYNAPSHGTPSAGSKPKQPIVRTHNAGTHIQDTAQHQPSQVQAVRQPQASQAARITAPNEQLQGFRRNLAVQPGQQMTKAPQVSLASFLQHNTYATASGQPGAFTSSQTFSPYASSPYTPPSGQSTPPPLGPSGGYPPPPASPVGNTQSYTAPGVGRSYGQQYNAVASEIHAIPQAPSNNAIPKDQQLKKQALSIDPCLARQRQSRDAAFSPPITPLSLDNDYGEPVATGGGAPNQKPSEARALDRQPEEGQSRSPKRPLEADREEVQRLKRRKSDDYQYETLGIALSIEHSSSPTALDMYAEVPCMDCGEMTGHKLGCHLGTHPLSSSTDAIDTNEFTDIAPIKNLTMLDYRILADSVLRLDPGPWTTHQGPPPEPEPEEPEEPETEIQRMAEIIRNEDTYMNDPDLHSLPDALMITLWALKTSSNVEVVYE